MAIYKKEQEDADLEDLLIVDETDLTTSAAITSTSTSTPKKPGRYYDYSNEALPSVKPSVANMCSMACTLCMYAIIEHKKPGYFITILAVAFILYGITVGFVVESEEVGISHYDMSNVKSVHDFKLGEIDHWCIHGGDVECKCEDPLNPTPRIDKKWIQAYQYTQSLLPLAPLPYETPPPTDVAFVGQSVIEVMNGRIMGQEIDTTLTRHAQAMFTKRFGPNNNNDDEESTTKAGKEGDMTGVALGLAGDSSANILYRLQHGYLSNTDFNPHVWWIVVGMEDLARWGCSEDVVIMGVLRIVEEIQKERPYAKVVINSLFPMTRVRHGMNDSSEFKDAERPSSAMYARKNEDGHGRRLGRRLPQGYTKKEWKQMSKKQRNEIMNNIKKEKKYEREFQKDEANPAMKDTHKMRNRNFFLRKQDTNLWPSVHTINQELKKFAGENPNVKFFDSTSIFATQSNGGGEYTLLTDKITVRGHPTEEGFHDWLDAVGKNAVPLVKAQRDMYGALQDDDDEEEEYELLEGDDDALELYGYDDLNDQLEESLEAENAVDDDEEDDGEFDDEDAEEEADVEEEDTEEEVDEDTEDAEEEVNEEEDTEEEVDEDSEEIEEEDGSDEEIEEVEEEIDAEEEEIEEEDEPPKKQDNGPLSRYFVHIPKTAGGSAFRRFNDITRKYVGHDYILCYVGADLLWNYRRWRNSYKEIDCRVHMSESPYREDILEELIVYTIVRNPREHVVSQYFHCLESPHHKRRDHMPSLTHWLANWTEGFNEIAESQNKEETWKKVLADMKYYNCYNPINLQSSYMDFDGSDEALKQLDDRYEVVGVSDRFEQTLCLVFIHASGGVIPDECNCSSSHRQLETVISHGVKHHAADFDTDIEQEAYIDKLTEVDKVLYDYISDVLFDKQIEKIEKQYNFTLCENPVADYP